MSDEFHQRAQRAEQYFREAYEAQMRGELDRAIELYERSIDNVPTAEAYTFLGWTYSFQGDYDRAIDYCKDAIRTDPSFGNPYNDIGAYLIELGKISEAIPWLEQAARAERYECYHYAHFNLGRVYEALGLWHKARECYEEAMRVEPRYKNARQAMENLNRLLN